MRHSYHIEGLTDIDVTRRQANERRTDKYSPQETLIHFHDASFPCREYRHEQYLFIVPGTIVIPDNNGFHVDQDSKILTWGPDVGVT